VGGSKPTGKNKCATCKGSGTIEKEIEKTCPDCKGEGKKKNLCILCNRSISHDKQLCKSCEVNPIIYQLIAPASTMTVEFNKTYTSKMVKKVDFGFFVQLCEKVEGLVRTRNFKEKETERPFVKLKDRKGGKLEFQVVNVLNPSQFQLKRVHDPISLQKIKANREVGNFLTIQARVENIRQIPRGPQIFSLLDETGVIEAAAFRLDFLEDIKVGNIVEVTGQYNTHRGTEQIEISDMFIVDEAYAIAFQRKMEKLLDEKSQPPEVNFLVKSDSLELLKPKFIKVAKRIRRALLEFQPIIIRHHNDADGITAGIAMEVAIRQLWVKNYETSDEDKLRHLVKRSVNKPPYYDPLDAVRDLNMALEDQKRFGDKLPIILMLDTGSSEESLFSYKLVKTYGIEIMVIDHHFPSSSIQETIDIHLNIYFSGGDYNICTGMLGCELARFVNLEISDTIDHLPAIAGMGDRVEGVEFNQYLSIAKEKGYSENFIQDIAIAVDYQAYFLKFSPGTLLLRDLLGLEGKHEKQINFVKLLASEARKHLENQLRISLEYVEEDTLPNGICLAVLDVEKYASRFDFPPPGKITGSLFDHLAQQDSNVSLVTVGLGPDFAIFRSQNVKLDFPRLVNRFAEKSPHAGVEGGGHEIVGSMKFVAGAREEITEMIRELLTLIEIPTAEV
jgi:RecJ-like exonuclease